jgi:uncharacterized protein
MKRRAPKEYVRYFTLALFVTLAGFVIAYLFVEPAPPRHITIATGQRTGAYYEMGQQYSRILARYGITLDVKPTSGSVENLKLIADKNSGIDVIFKQSGVGGDNLPDNLVSLGSLFYEPIWVFHRSELPVRHLSDLKGKKISVGIEGSGTRELSLQLLALNGVTRENSRFFQLNNKEAHDKLLSGEIDAAFFIVAYREHAGRQVLHSPAVKLLNMRRADAYTTRFHFLSSLILPEGAAYFEENIPDKDTQLLASLAHLVVRKDFHPALIDLMLMAAGQASFQGGLFEKPDEFPSPKYVDLPLSEDARRYYEEGMPFLQQYLPFWIANFLSRMKIMLVPLVALLFPIIKLLPPVYQWRMRSRIFRWYDLLMEIDLQILRGDCVDRKTDCLSSLDVIEKQVAQVSVPRGFHRELYDMRVHIELLREKLVSAAMDANQSTLENNGVLSGTDTEGRSGENK